MTTTNVRYLDGDIFTTSLPAIGHGANTQGFMGAGIAKTVREHYPEIYPAYRAACRAKELLPGGMLPLRGEDGRWILNLATQDKLGPRARLAWVETSFKAACDFAGEHKLVGIAVPRLGAGIGGLNWDDVRQVIETIAIDYPNLVIELWTWQPPQPKE